MARGSKDMYEADRATEKIDKRRSGVRYNQKHQKHIRVAVAAYVYRRLVPEDRREAFDRLTRADLVISTSSGCKVQRLAEDGAGA